MLTNDWVTPSWENRHSNKEGMTSSNSDHPSDITLCCHLLAHVKPFLCWFCVTSSKLGTGQQLCPHTSCQGGVQTLSRTKDTRGDLISPIYTCQAKEVMDHRVRAKKQNDWFLKKRVKLFKCQVIVGFLVHDEYLKLHVKSSCGIVWKKEDFSVLICLGFSSTI